LTLTVLCFNYTLLRNLRQLSWHRGKAQSQVKKGPDSATNCP